MGNMFTSSLKDLQMFFVRTSFSDWLDQLVTLTDFCLFVRVCWWMLPCTCNTFLSRPDTLILYHSFTCVCTCCVITCSSLSLSLSCVSSLIRWYYGNINRVKAEKLLLASQNKDGSFLVRISESHSDEYTISSKHIHPFISPFPTVTSDPLSPYQNPMQCRIYMLDLFLV